MTAAAAVIARGCSKGGRTSGSAAVAVSAATCTQEWSYSAGGEGVRQCGSRRERCHLHASAVLQRRGGGLPAVRRSREDACALDRSDRKPGEIKRGVGAHQAGQRRAGG